MRYWKRAILSLLVAVMAGFGLLAFPQPLFAHYVEHRNYQVWSDRPIAPEIVQVLDDATRRLRASDIYKPDAPVRIFFCNEPWLMWFYSQRLSSAMGGVADTWLTRNIYLRESDVSTNRLLAPGGGRLADADVRPLSYFIAHETTHIMQSREFGRLTAMQYPDWLTEGYADYVAKAGDFDFEENRRLLKAGDARLDYKKSGLYRRYHLLVALLLDKQRRSVREVYAAPPEEERVLEGLRALD